MAKDLVVSIATSGRVQLLERTLASLEACRKPDIFRGVVVVENGPRAGAEDVVRSFAPRINARYVHVAARGISRARNECIEIVRQISEDCLIFFTDDDVRIDGGTLCAYATAATGIDKGQLYGGPLGVDYEVEPPEWLKRYLPLSARGQQDKGGVQTYNAPYFLGANWAAFTKDLVATGGFSQNFGPGGTTGSTGEETNMQERLLKAGIKGIYLPDAMVWHYVPVERCSPKWAIRRIYLQRIESGLRQNRRLTFSGNIKTLIGLSWRLVKALSQGYREGIFAALFRLSHFLGFVRGSRLAQKSTAKRPQEM